MRLAMVLLLVASVWPARALASPATKLGDAYRAYRGGEYVTASTLADELASAGLKNMDYAVFVAAQSHFLLGDRKRALALFQKLADIKDSRFAGQAKWRVADCLFDLGQTRDARRLYQKLLDKPGGDRAVALYRIASDHMKSRRAGEAIAHFRRLVLEHPAHPYAQQAMTHLAGLGAPGLSSDDRITRAQALLSQKLWREALRELDHIAATDSERLQTLRDYWLGMSLFKMRRRYLVAGEILIGLYPRLDKKDQAHALFHGARALSRGHRDGKAIHYYHQLVDEFPRSKWADEALFLAGWLEFNDGNFKKGLPDLAEHVRRFPRSRFGPDARWYIAFSHYMLGQYEKALPMMVKVARQSEPLRGGQGQYWQARTLLKLGRNDEAQSELRKLVGRFPLSWYSLLARARLAEQGVEIGPFGDVAHKSGAPRASGLAAAVEGEAVIVRVDELIAANLGVEAGFELRRQERTLLRKHGVQTALPVLFDRYRKAENFNRPWMLAVVYGGNALKRPPEGADRFFWEHAYPLAYREAVERTQDIGKNRPYYLYTIMRKETGFDPHVVSYANAIGLMQMIPRTTKRVAPQLGMQYSDDFLFDPDKNLKVASWYIGRLAQKFGYQIPIAAGSYNAGPRAMMRWLDHNGKRPLDEFVELITYTQTRGYARKTTGSYARYLYLYDKKDYLPSLTVNARYSKNDINY